jgi:hypothetical protein
MDIKCPLLLFSCRFHGLSRCLSVFYPIVFLLVGIVVSRTLYLGGMCLVFLIIMALVPVDDPYYVKGEISKHRSEIDERLIGNANAPSTGAKYIVLMMFASLRYVIADVACDGVVVEFAQREQLEKRGHTQSMICTARFAA